MSYKIPREGGMLEERMIELVKNHLEISISTDISDFDNVDCHIYNESSADGYDLYICTNNTRQPSICEDVYYYDNALADRFREHIRWGDKTFYIDDGVYEDCYFDDTLLEAFSEHVEDIIENDIVANQSYVEENRRIDDESEEDEYLKTILNSKDESEYEMTLDLDKEFSYNWEDEFFKKFEWLESPDKKDINEQALNAKYSLFMDACSMLQGNFDMVKEKDPTEDPHYNKLYMYYISLEDENLFLHTDFKKSYEKVIEECLAKYDYVKLHKPQKVVFVMEIDDFYDVDKYVKMFMHIFGIEKTRGGSYKDVVLKDAFLETIEHEKEITQLEYYSNSEN